MDCLVGLLLHHIRDLRFDCCRMAGIDDSPGPASAMIRTPARQIARAQTFLSKVSTTTSASHLSPRAYAPLSVVRHLGLRLYRLVPLATAADALLPLFQSSPSAHYYLIFTNRRARSLLSHGGMVRSLPNNAFKRVGSTPSAPLEPPSYKVPRGWAPHGESNSTRPSSAT